MPHLVITGSIVAMTLATAVIVGPTEGEKLSWYDRWHFVLLIAGAGIILVILSLT